MTPKLWSYTAPQFLGNNKNWRDGSKDWNDVYFGNKSPSLFSVSTHLRGVRKFVYKCVKIDRPFGCLQKNNVPSKIAKKSTSVAIQRDPWKKDVSFSFFLFLINCWSSVVASGVCCHSCAITTVFFFVNSYPEVALHTIVVTPFSSPLPSSRCTLHPLE